MNGRAHIRRPEKAGQTFPIVVWMTAILVLMLVVAFDVFLTTRSKMRQSNTGDAAALAAAQWQGVTLNMIGDANLAHLAAACDRSLAPADRTNVINGVNAIAERIAFAGPAMALYAANECVRLNHEANYATRTDRTIPQDGHAAEIIRAEMEYLAGSVPPTRSWPTKGADCAAMLQSVLSAGVFTGADNASLLSTGAAGPHVYYEPGFYRHGVSDLNGLAVWLCRRSGHRHHLPGDAASSPAPGDLEAESGASLGNSGMFGVGIMARRTSLYGISPEAADTMLRAWNEYAGGRPVDFSSVHDEEVEMERHFAWYFLSTEEGTVWREWNELGTRRNGVLPLVGIPKPEYDVYGAMAAVRLRRDMKTVSGTSVSGYEWASAAKPFGMLPWGGSVIGMFSGPRYPGTVENAPLVVPAFSFVRLIPLGGVGERNLRRTDTEWVRHLDHLSTYQYKFRADSCKYCAFLQSWENGLREKTVRWYPEHDHSEYCDPPGETGRNYDDSPFNN